jgi:DNA repair protein RecN (Recombination protein N)
LTKLENYDFELEQAQKNFDIAKKRYIGFAKKLSGIRKMAAQKLGQQVTNELKQLGMPNARFEVMVTYLNEDIHHFSPHGLDDVRFLFSGNPGEELKSLSKIASGGEISRVMLALKKVFADKDDIPVLVFDEIDSGVSGETALAVGKKIHQLSKSHQLICITHLPQIAAQPGKHFKVLKEVKGNHTFTKIIALNENERVTEIARLIGGNTKEKSVIDSARFLLKQQTEE